VGRTGTDSAHAFESPFYQGQSLFQNSSTELPNRTGFSPQQVPSEASLFGFAMSEGQGTSLATDSDTIAPADSYFGETFGGHETWTGWESPASDVRDDLPGAMEMSERDTSPSDGKQMSKASERNAMLPPPRRQNSVEVAEAESGFAAQRTNALLPSTSEPEADGVLNRVMNANRGRGRMAGRSRGQALRRGRKGTLRPNQRVEDEHDGAHMAEQSGESHSDNGLGVEVNGEMNIDA